MVLGTNEFIIRR